MVHFLQCMNSHMPLPLLLSMLLLLLSSMGVASSDASRLPLRLLEIGTKETNKAETVAGGRALIGSRPPRCERVCMSCGHCEAIQVPVVPQDERRATRADQEHKVSATSAGMAYELTSFSNYKPLSWKCKCGSTIFDP